MLKSTNSVIDYSTATGTLTLQHAYPPPPYICSVASVDINVLLPTLNSVDTQVGEWVNVMGYVTEGLEGLGQGRRSGRRDMREKVDAGVVEVQAIILWSAGGVNLRDYEKAVLGRKRAGQT